MWQVIGVLAAISAVGALVHLVADGLIQRHWRRRGMAPADRITAALLRLNLAAQDGDESAATVLAYVDQLHRDLLVAQQAKGRGK